MSIHLEAKPGEITPSVLLPGGPMRVKWMATNFLEAPKLYNDVRALVTLWLPEKKTVCKIENLLSSK